MLSYLLRVPKYCVTKVYLNFLEWFLRDKKRLQKRFLSLKFPTRVAAGNAHYFLLEIEKLQISRF
jgi:hypothetical protein